MRSKARRYPVPRKRTPGAWLGQGPLATDDVTGWRYPKKDMVKQDGKLVYKDFSKRHGGRDRDQTW